MAIKSIMNLNKDLRTTLNNVPALIDTLEKGFAGVNDEISTGAEAKKAVDGFETINGGLLSSCKAALSPNQDLHGYDHPWAGGAGKNLLDTASFTRTSGTSSGITVTVDKEHECYTMVGTASDENINVWLLGEYGPGRNVFTLPSGTYYVKGVDLYDLNSPMFVVIGGRDGQFFTLTEEHSFDGIRAVNAPLGEAINETHYPFICKVDDTSVVPSYEPYSNICPISGHTQVDFDVSDGQATQEQVTVALGNTYYSGVLDIVSGVLTVDSAYIESYNGESLPSTWISDRDAYAPGTTPISGAEVVYKLAAPTTVQLSPTTVKALAGVNYITAPSDGQEIVEVEYKEIFTFEDVEKAIESAVSSVYPATPSEDGTYVLTLVKSGSTITRSWVSTEP